MSNKEIIDKIQEIRSRNNRLWMDILRLSMEKAEKETSKIMKEISENDSKILHLTMELADE